MTSAVTNYADILAAAQGLLGESVKIANESGLKYAVVGGWAPFLRNSDPIQHPGTKDVDLLFEDGTDPGALRGIVKSFLTAGYVLSAKHDFQILRELRVAGTDFIFNVDLLHPSESAENPELFVDHLDLPVPSNEFRSDSYIVKSIMIPNAGFIFEGHVNPVDVQCELPTGGSITFKIPLISEVALIITKSDSCKSPKRQRDAFDIYLTVTQSRDYRGLVKSFLDLKQNHRDVYNSLYAIVESMKNNHNFAKNVMRFQTDRVTQLKPANEMKAIQALAIEDTTVNTIENKMNVFFKDIQLDEKASLLE